MSEMMQLPKYSFEEWKMRIGKEGVVTGTQVAYAAVCSRKLWLFTKGINMEPFSERVEEGRTLHILSYPRKTKEIEVPGAGIKIDFCEQDSSIHEIKMSAAVEDAHVLQIAYYLWMFHRHQEEGISRGVIHYPKCRKTKEIYLTQEIQEQLATILEDIDDVTAQSQVPAKFPRKSFCRQCAYCEFCFA